ncbi:DUF1801 domain-containing protein [candidate division KSB1 bacterium]|nr:DUF1801 domain-containing protein [candidate division KSB1 bacterium]
MYQAKTKPTKLSVASYIAAIADDTRRADCKKLAAMMKRLTGCAPKMWGTSIVGFDSYHYKYDSGHEGDSCVVGFSSRKGDLSIYLMGGYESAEAKALLAQLGKHKIGKACLYVKRLADIQLPVLEKLVTRSVAFVKQRYPSAKK